VRRILLLGLAVAFLVVQPSAAGGWVRYERPQLGLSISHADWRPIHRRLTNCSNPVERIALAGPGGALFMLQESLGRRATQGMRPRPRKFVVRGAPSPLECCTPTRQPGWLLVFKDGGRGFYAYLYPGRMYKRAELVVMLNSLRVRSK
jgi:hypothetical protein